jgi:fructokinase
MPHKLPLLIGIGEVLWDLLPGGSHLGGAPANFAYMANLLGASGVLVSRVGTDELGHTAQRQLADHGVDISCLQVDPDHPTGSTTVSLSNEGVAKYSITENVAWDHLQWTPELPELAAQAEAVCFGTLAQRSLATRDTVTRFLEHTTSTCLKVLDVNLRPPFFDSVLLRKSLQQANVLKLSQEELAEVLRACSLPPQADEQAAQALRQHLDLQLVCITRGRGGSVMDSANQTVTHPGLNATVVDTIGAGDAFTATLAIQLVAGHPLEQVSQAANAVSAWIVSQAGAMPVPSAAERQRLRNAFGCRG